ncbi:MAG: hypothetical protein IJ228_02960 [Succinivibrio sp.]|nr:hypothetical protein [Succinivibrio sp.]
MPKCFAFFLLASSYAPLWLSVAVIYGAEIWCSSSPEPTALQTICAGVAASGENAEDATLRANLPEYLTKSQPTIAGSGTTHDKLPETMMSRLKDTANWLVQKWDSSNLLPRIGFVLSLFMLVVPPLLMFYFINGCRRRPNEEDLFLLQEVRKEQDVTVVYLLAYILPLTAFNVTSSTGVITFLIFIFLIGIVSIRRRLFYFNIFLELRGYNLYKATLVTAGKTTAYPDVFIISKQELLTHYSPAENHTNTSNRLEKVSVSTAREHWLDLHYLSPCAYFDPRPGIRHRRKMQTEDEICADEVLS